MGTLLFAHSSLFLMVPLALFLMGGGRVALALARSIVGVSSLNASAGAMFAVFTVLLGIVQTPAPEIGGILYESSPIQPFLIGATLTLVVAPLIIILEKQILRIQ